MSDSRQGIRGLIHDFTSACWVVIKLPFWLAAQGWRRLAALGSRKLLLLLAAAVAVTVVFGMVMIKATSQPGFCVSCHVMRPYFEAWETSTHNNITCTTCHVPPGLEGTIHHKFQALSMVANYFTGLYKRSKPWAEIEDAACLRGGCHETRLLAGTEDFNGVKFDHKPHLEQTRRDRQLRCTSCHAQIVQGTHISVTSGTCFLCHFMPDDQGNLTDLARCTHCHAPPTGSAAADTSFDHASILARDVDCMNCHARAVEGDGYVPPDRCNSCHAQLEHAERYGDREFVHQMHVTQHKVECLECHIAIRHGAGNAEETDPSQQCLTCHGGPQSPIMAVWKGRLPGLPRTPSTMAKTNMTCSSCHVEPIHRQDKGFGKPVCTPCHEETYNNLWAMWREPLQRSLAKLEQDVQKLPAERRDTLRQALEIFRKGNPAHNPDLYPLLSRAIHGTVERNTESCASCHPAASSIAPQWRGRAIPHRVHEAAGVACADCHETAESNHGALKLEWDACMTCHHQKAKTTDCAACHAYQRDVYTGKLNAPGAAPSAMSDAEVACADCHTVEGRHVARRSDAACAACHDADAVAMLDDWQKQTMRLHAATVDRLKHLRPGSKNYNSYQQLAAAIRRDGSRGVHNPQLFAEWAKRLEVTYDSQQ